ncbi:MAG: M10 family metallopeptidase domain-containing protein, partial [Actinomycetota bacterium]|nr:M10 family metallopeptidase domain-containing protein [Actinomycetota bacterium]
GEPSPPPTAAPEAFAAARTDPGTFATILLRPQPAARLVLEVLQEEGAEPQPATVGHLARVLQDSSGKPVSVATVALPAGGGAVTSDEVRALGDRYGRSAQGGGQAVVRMLFLGGQLRGEDAALGAAVRGDTAAVFVEQVRASSGPLVGASALEQAVATHELGHLLGLVDLVRSTGRADPEHPGHSPNRGSVMYWAIESDLVTSVLTGPPPRDFDAADRADLTAIRSGS